MADGEPLGNYFECSRQFYYERKKKPQRETANAGGNGVPQAVCFGRFDIGLQLYIFVLKLRVPLVTLLHPLSDLTIERL